MLKIVDKDGKVKFTLADTDEEPQEVGKVKDKKEDEEAVEEVMEDKDVSQSE